MTNADRALAGMTEAPTTDTLYKALLAVQAEAPTLQKTAINPHFRSKYVTLDALHEQILPLLNKHGLVWVTLPVISHTIVGQLAPEGVRCEQQPALHYRLIHTESGEEIAGTMPLCAIKADPQGQGSAITYARRYSLMAVLGLVADEDDDGNAASRPKPASTSRQAKTQPQRSQARSKPQDAPGGPSDATLAQLAEAYKASGVSAAGARVIFQEAAGGNPDVRQPTDLTEEQAKWATVKLRDLASQGESA